MPVLAAPRVDALVTAAPGLALAALVADCTPVLLCGQRLPASSPQCTAGRPGLIAGVVPAAVEAMRDLGAARIRAVVGPSVCGRCYEVPPSRCRPMRHASRRAAGPARWTGTTSIDIATGVVDQLVAAGVEVGWVAGCTRETEGLYSYRRDGSTGGSPASSSASP